MLEAPFPSLLLSQSNRGDHASSRLPRPPAYSRNVPAIASAMRRSTCFGRLTPRISRPNLSSSDVVGCCRQYMRSIFGIPIGGRPIRPLRGYDSGRATPSTLGHFGGCAARAIAQGPGHADRHAGLKGYCTGLMLPLARKSVEPMAARVDPQHASARHQALHHFVAKAEWSDREMLLRVCQWVVPLMVGRMLADKSVYCVRIDCIYLAVKKRFDTLPQALSLQPLAFIGEFKTFCMGPISRLRWNEVEE
jgi:hypothetical protein